MQNHIAEQAAPTSLAAREFLCTQEDKRRERIKQSIDAAMELLPQQNIPLSLANRQPGDNLSTTEAWLFLCANGRRVARNTLAVWRGRQMGPPAVKRGGRWLYPFAQLRASLALADLGRGGLLDD